MRVLIACEFSGLVREAFRKKGHDAWSCDLLDTDIPGNHIIDDVLMVIKDGWDLMIGFPPCTYLCSSGYHWNYSRPDRSESTRKAVGFFKALLDAPIDKIAIENPVGIISSIIRKPDQIIQPYQYGENASKKTCLWLKNLPLLVPHPNLYIPPRIVNAMPRWDNQTDTGQSRLGPSVNRAKIRSKTYPGIAKAMADFWG